MLVKGMQVDAVSAALEAQNRLGPDAKIVTVLPDRMERYFSTELFGALDGES